VKPKRAKSRRSGQRLAVATAEADAGQTPEALAEDERHRHSRRQRHHVTRVGHRQDQPRRRQDADEAAARDREGGRVALHDPGDEARRRRRERQDQRDQQQRAPEGQGERARQHQVDGEAERVSGGREQAVVGEVEALPAAVLGGAQGHRGQDLPALPRQHAEGPREDGGEQQGEREDEGLRRHS